MGIKQEKQPAAGAPVLPLKLLFLLAPCALGLFYEPLAALAALALLGYLAFCAARGGGLRLPRHILFGSVSVLVLCYAASPLWAADRGMALLGAVKFLPLPLFALACAQLTAAQRREILDLLPWGGGAMTLLSGALALLPGASALVLVDGRLAGFFQYPNTFALYALLGAAVLVGRERWRGRDIACLVVLLAGVALSGSRTVLALLAALAAAACFLRRVRRESVLLVIAAAAVLAAAVLLPGQSDAVSAAGRALAGGSGASTFYGRLLYFRDALPVILSPPLGLGYLGYYFLQGSFQTGVYSVVHVHNDLLQFILDVGWLPGALLAWAVVKGFLDAKGAPGRRLVIALAAAHAMFDFDLQFTAMGCILLLALMPDELAAARLPAPGALAAGGALALLCLYFGTASALYYLGDVRGAASVYPGYTLAWIDLMTETDDPAAMEDAAEQVLRRNDAVSLAHSALARADFSRGDIGGMIAEKRRAIALAKYDRSTYLDYFDMLSAALGLYEAAGDGGSAAYCRACLLEIPDLLQNTLEGTSALGRRIADQPELELPADYRAALDALR